MNEEQLKEELAACVRAAIANPPTPAEDSPAFDALKEAMGEDKVLASVALPQLLAGINQWGGAIAKIMLAYAALGIEIDMAPRGQTGFLRRLSRK